MSDYHEGLEEGIKIGRAESAAEIACLRVRVAELEGALRKINDKDSYSGGSYGPFAEIARAALEGKKDE